jgi:hypothetical protein
MSKFWVVIAASVSALAAIPTPPAQADDAYICDDGRLVYARPETLDKLKSSDPCVAKYFNTTPPPLAQHRNKGTSVSNAADAVSTPATPAATTQTASPLAPAAAAKPRTPEASVGTDFRNVRVINAPAGQGEIFRHMR